MGGMIGKSYALISAEADKENPQEWRVVDSITTNDSTKWNGRAWYDVPGRVEEGHIPRKKASK